MFTDNGLTLTATVSYAGLGNFDTLQTLSATGDATATCTNPAGQTQPPGQNPAPVDTQGATAVPREDIKNGNVTISTVTNPPTTPIAGAPDCPNTQWTEAITDVAFTSATIMLFQDSNENGLFDGWFGHARSWSRWRRIGLPGFGEGDVGDDGDEAARRPRAVEACAFTHGARPPRWRRA